MTIWILAVLGLFFVQTLLPAICQYVLQGTAHIKTALGPRDNPPPIPTIGGRFERALVNMRDAIIIFLPLALLAQINDVAQGLAVQGAMVFFVARLAYVPAYVSGIPGLRSVIWMIGHAGLGMMIAALVCEGSGTIAITQ